MASKISPPRWLRYDLIIYCFSYRYRRILVQLRLPACLGWDGKSEEQTHVEFCTPERTPMGRDYHQGVPNFTCHPLVFLVKHRAIDEQDGLEVMADLARSELRLHRS